ncbi:NAD(P)-dependent oxidoreductase [Parvivirga hydrogeniphila]|uniref:NAD(P)-dependent oxidoreductase n=1 Tax=Parvivirga hydrogeniphila TaxID=2939460 RepID=UPI002260CDB2|nr:NAD(P)-dependent oxidoreductase [Parvivirga hydrogeniphila]
MSHKRPTVAFIGTGVMGAAMARHLLDAGYPLVVFNRTKAKAEPLLDAGAIWAGSAGEAASMADVTITMVGYPRDVEEVYLAPGGIIDQAPDGALLVDMTTSTPTLAVRIAEAAAARGLAALDAPVSGGDVGARNATLTIMVGGDAAAYERALPLFEVMGKTVTLMGGPGAGQHTKMANQIGIAGTMLGLIEALQYAKAAGLDLARVHAALSGGGANSWSWGAYGPRILAGDFAPGFYVKHFVKDLRIALDEARTLGLALPGLGLAERLYARLHESGGAELGTHALWLLYERGEQAAPVDHAGD